jgi:hypothetical protein
MSESPAAKVAGEAIGTLIGLLLTAGIDSDMQRASRHHIEGRPGPAIPLRRKLRHVLHRLRLKSPARPA